ncbi:unnamed protein product [Mycena citricolor]|uniref:Cytochrome P450 n=1 Tax=Mycena citricolor TaxID=2018698 RepID=A0AAD2HY57_9AGAR|nr:unnamed protein product [Mycena citricolor]
MIALYSDLSDLIQEDIQPPASNPNLMSLSTTQCLPFLVITSSIIIWSWTRKMRPSLPPGPPRLPLIGNLLDIPAKEPWLAFSAMGDKYGTFFLSLLSMGPLSHAAAGEITSLAMPGRTTILLHTLEAATSVLVQSSALTSERPVLPMAGGLCGFETSLPLAQPSGDLDQVRRERKLYHAFQGTPTAISRLIPGLVEEVGAFLRAVDGRQGVLSDDIRRTTMAIGLRLGFGHKVNHSRPTDLSDTLFDMAEQSSNNFFRITTPGASFVDLFPFLRYWPSWLPGGGFHHAAKRINAVLQQTRYEGLAAVRERMATGVSEPCFATAVLETDADEYWARVVPLTLVHGASDTTASQLSAFFLAMALHPDIQRNAQQEIDRVIGRDRLPTVKDRPELPHVDALSREVLRWFVTTPTALPHRANESFIYESSSGPVLIPKDSMIIANVWKMNRDPRRYRNPEQFDPSRFLGTEGRAPEEDPGKTVFGFGRRACPGETTLFLLYSALLSVFDIGKALDERGEEIDIAVGWSSMTVTHPLPFQCAVRTRDEAARKLIRGL